MIDLEKIKLSISDFVQKPITWIILTIAFIVVYALVRKRTAPALLDVRKILSDYFGIFVSGFDTAFFVLVPFFLSLATALERQVDSEIADILCVVISILAAAVISFMAMTSDKAGSLSQKEWKTQDDFRSKTQCDESIAIGMFETFLSVILLVIIFLRPIFAQTILSWFLGLLIYFLFYSFLFNLLIMMRRLHQIYNRKT